MARSPAADRKQKSQQAANTDPDIEAAANDDTVATTPEDVTTTASRVEREAPEEAAASSGYDVAALNRAGTDLHSQLRDLAASIEAASRGYEGLTGQIERSNDEITRLKAVEIDRTRLNRELEERNSVVARLETELNEARAATTAATERAAKFEEVCESIKERAFELHTALQEARSAEQRNADELAAAKSQIADVGRLAQDEGVARVAAEERAQKLEADFKRAEADEMTARERIAKLMEDNKTMAAQVPALLVDRERWQKQLSASERENARLVNERQMMVVRIADLEEEIRTLRSDLSSLTSAATAPTVAAAPVAAVALPPPAKVEQAKLEPARAEPARSETARSEAATPEPDDLSDDDLDLEASLERVFAQDMASFADKDSKH